MDKKNNSLDIFISSINNHSFFETMNEEYNALKSSGRMELIDNEDLYFKKVRDYYTLVDFVKTIDVRIAMTLKSFYTVYDGLC